MKTILMFPQKQTKINQYLSNLVKTVSGTYNVVGVDEAIKKKCLSLFRYDICHLNWFENIKSKGQIKSFFEFSLRFLFLTYLKTRNRPIVWTVHNKVPHNQDVSRKYSVLLMNLLMRWSTRIHILCEETIDEIPQLFKYKNKIVEIPHGDYFNNYGEGSVDLYAKYNIKREKKIILFTGKIGPYKNIQLLVDAFLKSGLSDDDFVLLIRGACSDANYKKHLEKSLSEKAEKVYLDFHFIPNEEMGDFLNQSTILVAPYDIESTLNSGTLWMAFSYRKTIICPKIGCVRSSEKLEDIGYFYNYVSAENHLDALIQQFSRLKEDVKNQFLIKKETEALLFMQNNSWEKKSFCWKKLYEF